MPTDTTPLSARWETVLGTTSESLIAFLQVINDELDTQLKPSADLSP